jgi:protein SCO1/2
MNKVSGLWSPYAWLYLGMVVFGLGVGIFVANRQTPEPPVYLQAQMLPATKTLPGFALHNQHGELINAEVWRGHWSLVFFGFTSCPDICPLELQKLGKLLRSVGEG